MIAAYKAHMTICYVYVSWPDSKIYTLIPLHRHLSQPIPQKIGTLPPYICQQGIIIWEWILDTVLVASSHHRVTHWSSASKVAHFWRLNYQQIYLNIRGDRTGVRSPISPPCHVAIGIIVYMFIYNYRYYLYYIICLYTICLCIKTLLYIYIYRERERDTLFIWHEYNNTYY